MESSRWVLLLLLLSFVSKTIANFFCIPSRPFTSLFQSKQRTHRWSCCRVLLAVKAGLIIIFIKKCTQTWIKQNCTFLFFCFSAPINAAAKKIFAFVVVWKTIKPMSHTHKWALLHLCFISDCFEHLSRSQNPSLTITHAITNSFGLPFNLSFPIFAQVFILLKKRCGALKSLCISVNLLPLSNSTITLFECFLRSLWSDIKFGNAETAKRKRKLFKAKYKSNPNESLKRNRAKCSSTRRNI